MRDPAKEYRESAVRGASPVGLIVILYEEIVRSLHRAHRAIQRNDIEQRTLALTHAIKVIGHLQGILDLEHGGRVARNLSKFYSVMRAKIVEANVQSNQETLETLAREFSGMVEAWRRVDEAVCGQQAAVASREAPATAIAISRLRLQGVLAER